MSSHFADILDRILLFIFLIAAGAVTLTVFGIGYFIAEEPNLPDGVVIPTFGE